MNRRYFLRAAGLTMAATQTNAVGALRMPESKLTATEIPLPQWAQTGNFVFMGLDGGPLEAQKGLRSGWQGFSRDDPQGIVRAVHEFYRPENVEIPRAAGATWVYVTWSNGWSKERERRDQWSEAARFIKECQKDGLHVSAYISAANMFWEDYLPNVPQSLKWIDTQQPSLMRHYGGSLYRVMANLKLADWRREIKTAIDSALDAGVEGFWIDNMFWWHSWPLFQDFMSEMRAHAARRKSEVVWHTNVNRGIYHWARVGNVVGTEDGRAPKYTPGDSPAISSNLGLLSYLAGLREGWRSAELEHYGLNLSAPVRQLMIAEGWLWQVGTTWFPVDRLLQARWHRREPEAWKILTEMGRYNRHYLKHGEYFKPGEALASVGIIGHAGGVSEEPDAQKLSMDGQSRMIELLDRLAGWNIQYEVLFEDRLSSESLRKFAVLVLSDPDHIPSGLAESLKAYLQRGGRLIAPERTWLSSLGGNTIFLPQAAFVPNKEPELLRNAIRKYDDSPAVEAAAPPSIVYRGLRQGGRVLLHLLNYQMEPVEPFTVHLRGNAKSVAALIPESGEIKPLKSRQEGGRTVVSVPEFPIHCLLVFNGLGPGT